MTSLASSVVVCAYTLDRWDDLQAAVESAATGAVKPMEILVIIDHNDQLLKVATAAFRAKSAEFGVGIRVLPNSRRQGLSGARNTAIDVVRGEVVAFLDDDARADRHWLRLLLEHYTDPVVLGVGGAARPVWPGGDAGRPAFLPAATAQARGEFDWVVGCTYTGLPVRAAAVRNLMGCNMSFRRAVFEGVGGFSLDLGRIGRTPLGCEETEFCIRVKQFDPSARIVFEPAAVVRHRVTPDRMRWQYLVSRCWSEGLSKAAVSRVVGQDAALESERRYVTAVLPKALLRQTRAGLRGSGSGWTGAVAIVAALATTSAGYVRGRLGHRHPGLGDQVPTVAATAAAA